MNKVIKITIAALCFTVCSCYIDTYAGAPTVSIRYSTPGYYTNGYYSNRCTTPYYLQPWYPGKPTGFYNPYYSRVHKRFYNIPRGYNQHHNRSYNQSHHHRSHHKNYQRSYKQHNYNKKCK